VAPFCSFRFSLFSIFIVDGEENVVYVMVGKIELFIPRFWQQKIVREFLARF
jgi:hypothetical protein